jgi:hypothetical protein
MAAADADAGADAATAIANALGIGECLLLPPSCWDQEAGYSAQVLARDGPKLTLRPQWFEVLKTWSVPCPLCPAGHCFLNVADTAAGATVVIVEPCHGHDCIAVVDTRNGHVAYECPAGVVDAVAQGTLAVPLRVVGRCVSSHALVFADGTPLTDPPEITPDGACPALVANWAVAAPVPSELGLPRSMVPDGFLNVEFDDGEQVSIIPHGWEGVLPHPPFPSHGVFLVASGTQEPWVPGTVVAFDEDHDDMVVVCSVCHRRSCGEMTIQSYSEPLALSWCCQGMVLANCHCRAAGFCKPWNLPCVAPNTLFAPAMWISEVRSTIDDSDDSGEEEDNQDVSWTPCESYCVCTPKEPYQNDLDFAFLDVRLGDGTRVSVWGD